MAFTFFPVKIEKIKEVFWNKIKIPKIFFEEIFLYSYYIYEKNLIFIFSKFLD